MKHLKDGLDTFMAEIMPKLEAGQGFENRFEGMQELFEEIDRRLKTENQQNMQ